MGLEHKHKNIHMKNFKDLEDEILNETPMPLGIKSNVQGQLSNMRTFGGIIELYLSKIIDLFIDMFGGTNESTAKTHLVRLFVPRTVKLEQSALLEKLQSSFDLSIVPVVFEQDAKGTGVELTIKMSAKDAAQLSKINNRSKLADLQIELR